MSTERRGGEQKGVKRSRSRLAVIYCFAAIAGLGVVPFGSRDPLLAQELRGSVETIYQIDRGSAGGLQGGIDERWSSRQIYTLNYDRPLSPYLSYNLILRGSMDQRKDERGTNEITPQLFFNSDNPYYRSNGGFTWNQRRNLQGTALTSRMLTSTFSPKLSPLLPEINLFQTMSWDRDDLSTHEVDAANRSLRLSLDYPLPILKDVRVSYNYDWNKNQDFTSDNREVSQRHDGKVGFSKTLWNRLSFTGNWGLEESNSSSSFPGAFVSSLFARGGLSAVDSTPATGPLEGNPRLIDRDTLTPANIDLRSTDNNLGIDLGGAREVNRIFISMSRNFVEQPDRPQVVWEVYWSDEGLNWTPIAGRPSVIFNFPARRYEISFPPVRARFFKAVNRTVSDSLEGAEVTEIGVASTAAEEEPSARETRHTTYDKMDGSLGLSFRATEWLVLDTNTSYQRQKNTPGDQVKVDQLFSGGLSFTPSKYFMTRLGISRTQDEDDSPLRRSERQNTSYSLSLSSEPLETLKSSFSLALSNIEESSELVTRSLSALFDLQGDPYQGIEVGMSYGWTRSKNFDRDTQTLTQSLLWELNLLPQDWIRWESSYALSWSHMKSGARRGGSSSFTQNLQMDLLLTPSSSFQFKGRLDTTRSGGNTTAYYRIESFWLPTEKLSLSASYLLNRVMSKTNDRMDDLSLSLFWRMNRATDFNVNYGYNRKSAVGNPSQDLLFHFISRF